jgi:Protein of unknown function (DUF3379)
VTCDQARLLIGAQPGASDPALEEHLRTCGACRQFREEMRALDGNIRRALERPPALAAPRAPARSPWREWALAAGVLLATMAAVSVWLLRPSETLAHEVVAHVQAEPNSWLAQQHVSAAEIGDALKGAGVALHVNSDKVMYASSCWFRGHYVPHLVVQTDAGPATVMLLRHEHVRAQQSFNEDGLSGVIVPSGAGSIAVLTRGAGNPMAIAGQMQQDVQWLPQGK